MALKTREQFIDSVAKLKPRLFIAGERVENLVEHPNIIPVINTLAKTYELEQGRFVIHDKIEGLLGKWWDCKA